ncbi:MAG: hypothetical protein CBC35_10935 [Planctomycetes bacterium TMED75]|nr:hypothetical protein [Planctomycetaceae bacterium]OUU90767.1 MAG: hypothetical protein CBC35_10935 [Planctomycetes bacterium TMED75]
MSETENSLCGTCEHFGNDIPEDTLVQIRINPQARGQSIAACDLPTNASLHLKVSAVSSCDAYSPAA